MIPGTIENEFEDLTDDYNEQAEKIFEEFDDGDLEDEWDEFDEEEFPDEEED